MRDPAHQRRVALEVLEALRDGGHETYFVGGCVRDELLGRQPREFDVATSARPEEVEALFPHTVAVGRQFGVVVVIREALPVEVATFRSDHAYVDGRRPTGVTFTSAREDAERRDFTVNGLFLDPLSGEIHDFVGGREDLDRGLLRAIGDPAARFAEDRLRILRAVRFATTLGFPVEDATWRAACEAAPHILEVAWERIREELSRIVVSGRSAQGLRMLRGSGLLERIIPELTATVGVEQPPQFHPEGDVWIHTVLAMEGFDDLAERPLALGLAILLHDVGKPPTYAVTDRIRFDGHDRLGADMTRDILRRLRYPNDLIAEAGELVRRHMAFIQIREWREAKLRRFLLHPQAESHLEMHRLDCLAAHGDLSTLEWCRERREAFLAETPPPPRLVSGGDLLAAGYPAGPIIGRILAEVDDERLEGRLATKEEALAWALARFPIPEDA